MTHYFAPVLSQYNNYRCRRMEGTCIIRKPGQADQLYNVGYGTQVRSRARNGCRNGYGNRGNCLHPFKVIAADRRYHRNGDILYFPSLRGLKIGNQYHDGFVQVADVGGAIKGSNRFDFFVGECTRFKGDSCKSVDGGKYERLLSRAQFCKASGGAYQTALLNFNPNAPGSHQVASTRRSSTTITQ